MQPTSPASYPARTRGELTEPVNRWLFLIKWLLIVPHLIVLWFLFVGFAFSWLASLIAILFTGSYPRSLFDYNVGVIRWAWRVGFYSYQALGTDRYPPFSLDDDPQYPASFTVDYPGKLSQGLVLIKWWLLALPHYVVVVIFSGGFGYKFGGLTLILVAIGAIVNLFTGRYPKDIFTLVMGMNRWVLRVAAYAALMTDQYPPFSFGE